jgi:integrase
MADAGLSGDAPQGAGADASTKRDSELAGDLAKGVSSFAVGPVSAQVAGDGATRPGHGASVQATVSVPATLDELRAHVRSIYDGYTPRFIPGAHWAQFRLALIEILVEADAPSVGAADNWVRELARYAYWAWQQGMPVTREVLMRLDLLDHYVTSAPLHVPRTAEKPLRAIRTRLEGVDRQAVRSTLSRVGPGFYTSTEMAAFASWANSQDDRRRRTNAFALLSFTAGAGLRPGEFVELRVGDVSVRSDMVVVSLSDRRTAVVDLWDAAAREAVAGRAADEYVFDVVTDRSDPRILQSFIRRTRGSQLPVPDRLRATWLMNQLIAGTPVDVLCSAAGLTTSYTLRAYFPFLQRDEQESFAALRNAEARR